MIWRTFLFHLSQKKKNQVKDKTKEEVEGTAYVYLPGESFPQSEVPEKQDLLQSRPQRKLSGPRC